MSKHCSFPRPDVCVDASALFASGERRWTFSTDAG